MNSMIEASRCAIPVVVIPIFLDQFRNSQMSVKHGTGIALDRRQVTGEILIEALEKVLNDKRLLFNANLLLHLNIFI
jgi:UDP:flavonoid glycosyltransferase YjiC (YdhE family)